MWFAERKKKHSKIYVTILIGRIETSEKKNVEKRKWNCTHL